LKWKFLFEIWKKWPYHEREMKKKLKWRNYVFRLYHWKYYQQYPHTTYVYHCSGIQLFSTVRSFRTGPFSIVVWDVTVHRKRKKTESCDRPLEQRNRRNRAAKREQEKLRALGFFFFKKKLSGSRFSQCSFGILLPRLGIWFEAHKFTNYDETERESGASWVFFF
jgi:hypothetical protein